MMMAGTAIFYLIIEGMLSGQENMKDRRYQLPYIEALV